MVFGMVAGALATVWFTRLTPGSRYATAILPALIVLGLAMATIMAPAFATATSRVQPSDAGVASAMVNTMQQVGTSVGTALLSSIFATAVAARLDQRSHTPDALRAASVHGYTVAFWFAAGLFAVGALTVAALMAPTESDVEVPTPESQPERVAA
jgi:MFS family permease